MKKNIKKGKITVIITMIIVCFALTLVMSMQFKIVNQTDIEAAPVQGEKEILMLYTCYPVNSIGHATHRFITYSSLD